ncbi:MAG: glycerol kinase GlpK [Gammaproteobacteria bacterium]|jgi:glycerol kinase|nr:glycerol kinase GlpK [Gammaproteobacteria bacterium]
MAASPCVLAIDQGTTSSRAIVFDVTGQRVSVAQAEYPQLYPGDGWVEHDPAAIWQTTLQTARDALRAAEDSGHTVVALGITNQRETVVLWDRATGHPLGNAIVWQDRRTAAECERLRAAGHEPEVTARTGLLLDPYFSATKIAWLLDNIPGARERARAGQLACGTIDSFLIWQLTGGREHLTDATNASRTSLFNIHTQRWDDWLLECFDIPARLLPAVRDCNSHFGTTDSGLLGREIPILGVAGDQQAAALGQGCMMPGAIKSTYGTGCFVLVITGDAVVQSSHRLLSTVAYRLDGQVSYALEGSIFVAGAAIQWLRDGLGIIESAAATAALARDADPASAVYLVPAFTGLGAPHWRPEARGALLGLTRATGIAEIARAALEAVAYQTNDLLEAMQRDGVQARQLRVDGGMVANDWFAQRLADLLNLTVDRPQILETTAYGAALLAGQGAGIYGDWADIEALWRLDQQFEPSMAADVREQKLAGWRDALRRVMA